MALRPGCPGVRQPPLAAPAWIAKQRVDTLRLLLDNYAALCQTHKMLRHHWQERREALQATLATSRAEMKRLRETEEGSRNI